MLSGTEADYRRLARLCIEMKREARDTYARDYFLALEGLADELARNAKKLARERARAQARREPESDRQTRPAGVERD